MKPAIERLRHARVRTTSSRISVLEAIEQSQLRRMRVEDVIRALMQSGADMSLASVYRSLRELTREGILVRSWDRSIDEQKYSYWIRDGAPTADTHRMTCTVCGKTVSLDAPQLEDEIRRAGEQAGMAPRTARIEIRVTCAGCDEHVDRPAAAATGKARSPTRKQTQKQTQKQT